MFEFLFRNLNSSLFIKMKLNFLSILRYFIFQIDDFEFLDLFRNFDIFALCFEVSNFFIVVIFVSRILLMNVIVFLLNLRANEFTKLYWFDECNWFNWWNWFNWILMIVEIIEIKFFNIWFCKTRIQIVRICNICNRTLII